MKAKVYILLQILWFLVCAFAFADVDTPLSVRLEQTASGRGQDYVTEISDSWKFGGKDLDGSIAELDDSAWMTVNLPHTWNILDGADGGSYERTAYWYRKTITLDSIPENKRIYLEFLGVNQRTDVYVNSIHMKLSGNDQYAHKGGYTAFRYDITSALHAGKNKISVKVDNRFAEDIAPIAGDFNMYGGIYRRVYLIEVDDVHVDLSNNGSCGLFLTTPNIRSREKPADLGKLNIRADIVNQGSNDRTITVTAHIDGDNAPADITRILTVPAGGSVPFNEDVFIPAPHLWKGIDYSGKTDNSDVGYRYNVTLSISVGRNTIDSVSDHVGFRFFYVDKETGFYLNGESYPLHGVNRHQYMERMGSAIKEIHHANDIAMIMELGANTVRLSHYPQADYFYELCDQNGIIIWTEIPLVNAVGKSEYFMDITKAQLTELIRQQYNHPCICFWNLENEVRNEKRNEFFTAKELIYELNLLAHAEDPTGRYTTQATNHNFSMDENDPTNLDNNSAEIGWKTDLLGWNLYPGWYSRDPKNTIETLSNNKASRDSRPLALSEYGWGASVDQHELYPELGKNDLLPAGKWHPEEYQNLMHEQAISFINSQRYLFATYIWAMFDFDVDSRDEGSRIAQNDKGLVTNDRQTKKDSFYLYKANWNKLTPFVHITSSRFTTRDTLKTYVKVYSNCDSVDLYLNGELIGPMENKGNCIFVTEDVTMVVGENKMCAVGRINNETCDDTCLWIRNALSTVELQSDLLHIDQAAHTISLPYAMTTEELKTVLTGVDNARYTILSGNQTVTDENALVTVGMTAAVVSENGSNAQNYTFVLDNLLLGKQVTASSTENDNIPENILDGNSKTRWVASSSSYPQSITADLGKEYTLDTISIDWFSKKNRSYTYVVEASSDGINYQVIADRSDNNVVGTTTDVLRAARGRYIRVQVLSCSQKDGYASLHDMQINGWLFDIQGYKVDYDNKLIFISDMNALTVKDFADHLTVEGNCALSIQAADDYIHSGDQVQLTDAYGRKTIYTVTDREFAYRYFTDLALYKTVLFSSEEGFSQKTGTNTHAYNINDGHPETAWTAETKSNANYPEWIGVDLGREFGIFEIDMQFETKDDRVYQYEVYALPDQQINWSEDFLSKELLIIDQSGNKTFDDGHYHHEIMGNKGRYVIIRILGNSLYPDNNHAAASLYDLQVYGTSYDSYSR